MRKDLPSLENTIADNGLPIHLIKLVSLLVLILISVAPARGNVRLPKMLSDHAVLQRDRPIHLWGWATPEAHLSMHFNKQTVASVADSFGHWSVYLAPEHAGGPYVLTINGDGPETKITDILVGDVWLASGQSNMEMPLSGFPYDKSAVIKDAEKEIASASNSKVRLLLVEHKGSDLPLVDISKTWTTCTPETARNFSAIAYFFGREIAAKEDVPIGLIDSTWGGTPAEAWVSLDTLGSNAALLPAFASRATFINQEVDLDNTIAIEKRQDELAIAAGKAKPSHPWHPEHLSYQLSGLYNGMIAPFAPMTIKGFLWYQGETNTSHDRAYNYDSLFSALIADWRGHFAQGQLPFLYVQISSFNSAGDDWGLVREQQRRTLAVANTAMVVSHDVGLADNIHPPDKQTVATRLALAARGLVYGEAVAYRGPLFRQATTELAEDGSTVIRVWFDFSEGLTFRNKPITGFELAGADHHFMKATAQLDGETIVVRSAAVPHPLSVRFDWMSVVPDSLYNAAGLPASTFTSERTTAH